MTLRKAKVELAQLAEYQYEGKQLIFLEGFLASLNLIFYIYLLM
jgi:hypothetical protein